MTGINFTILQNSGLDLFVMYFFFNIALKMSSFEFVKIYEYDILKKN